MAFGARTVLVVAFLGRDDSWIDGTFEHICSSFHASNLNPLTRII